MPIIHQTKTSDEVRTNNFSTSSRILMLIGMALLLFGGILWLLAVRDMRNYSCDKFCRFFLMGPISLWSWSGISGQVQSCIPSLGYEYINGFTYKGDIEELRGGYDLTNAYSFVDQLSTNWTKRADKNGMLHELVAGDILRIYPVIYKKAQNQQRTSIKLALTGIVLFVVGLIKPNNH